MIYGAGGSLGGAIARRAGGGRCKSFLRGRNLGFGQKSFFGIRFEAFQFFTQKTLIIQFLKIKIWEAIKN